MDAVEDGLFNIRIIPLQAAEQGLDLLPLGAASAVVANGAVFHETAGALDKFQLIYRRQAMMSSSWIMMAQGNFIAAQLLRLAVKMPRRILRRDSGEICRCSRSSAG